MPHIRSVSVSGADGISGRQSNAAARHTYTVNASLAFSRIELDLGLVYNCHAYLFERDERRDNYSCFPNHSDITMHRTDVMDGDDFMAKSEAIVIKAEQSRQDLSIPLTFSGDKFGSFERDSKFEVMAFLSVNPVTSAAMKWSRIKQVDLVIS